MAKDILNRRLPELMDEAKVHLEKFMDTPDHEYFMVPITGDEDIQQFTMVGRFAPIPTTTSAGHKSLVRTRV